MKRRSVGAQLAAGLVVVLAGIFVTGCTQSAPTAIPTADTGVVATQPSTHADPAIPASAASPTPAPVPTPVSGCLIKELKLGSPGTGAAFEEPDVATGTTVTLTVQYGDNKIGECPVHLRSYNGQLVGPTLRARPGDTLRITLVNDLPPDDVDMHHVMNTIGDLNHTNLHTHGLHVSPAGNSDNVLLDIAPGQTFEYEIKVPLNQVPGTYWYHAHLHGSTATQVSSGMAGALIIMGDTSPDTVDSLPEVKGAAEKIFVFQQIAYDEAGLIEPDSGGGGGTFPSNSKIAYFGPCNWEPMMREHTINGQLFPTVTLKTGEVQRWRFIDAGIRESIGVELRGPYTGSGTPTITDVLKLPLNNLNEIAVDGIPLYRVDAWPQVDLEPGYRSDVLVQLTEPGQYFLVDNGVLQTIVTRDPNTGNYTTKTEPSFSLTCSKHEQPGFLATVVVTGPKTQPTDFTALSDEMANLPVPEILKPIVAITTDKTINPYNEAFLVPLETIDAFQKVDFTVAGHPSPATGPVEFMAADHPFDPLNRRRLKLNNTDEWVLNTQEDSLYYGHPFHIHINSFQTWRPGPAGTPELVWRDTLMVYQGITSYVYTRYADYIGAYVYHCHILDHEDQGMMELVEVVQ